MYVVKVTWQGGTNWDPTLPSSFNPNKTKSAVEHLIETGGQTIDDAIESFDMFRPLPIKVFQEKSDDPKVNWITNLMIEETDEGKAEAIRDKLVEAYTKQQKTLENGDSGYSIAIEVVTA